jgi:PAS domain S-box-containing protein
MDWTGRESQDVAGEDSAMQSILIVDDTPQNLYFLEVLLKGNGFAVRFANNGGEALESARNSIPDLIISDILMPVMDGYTLCRECKADERLKRIPFIFYTATFIEKSDERLALGLGATRFVVKPQEPDVLLAIIREVLAGTATSAAGEPVLAEQEILKGYGEALFRKLEKKVAELERANQQLRESEQDFRQFVMECPMPIALNDRNGGIELVNNRFVDLTGYTLSDIPTVDAWWPRAYPDSAYREEVRVPWQKAVETAFRDGVTIRPASEYRVTRKDGAMRIIEIFAAPIRNRMLIVFNDITGRKQAEKERAEMQAHVIQQDKMASVGLLAAGVAHEINNPMSYINANLKTLDKYANKLMSYIATVEDLVKGECGSAGRERLAEERSRLKIDDLTGDIRDMLSECFEGVERITGIVNDLKVFSHNNRVETRAIDLNHCCDTVITIVWNEIKSVATLRKEYGDIPLVICNSQQIGQVVMNLLLNAAQAIHGNGEITLRTWSDGCAVFMSVSDTGVGIAAEHSEHIFEAFFTTKDVGKGTGLGLSISADIIKRHGGTITVESVVGKGATFTVMLPLEPARVGEGPQ